MILLKCSCFQSREITKVRRQCIASWQRYFRSPIAFYPNDFFVLSFVHGVLFVPSFEEFFCCRLACKTHTPIPCARSAPGVFRSRIHRAGRYGFLHRMHTTVHSHAVFVIDLMFQHLLGLGKRLVSGVSCSKRRRWDHQCQKKRNMLFFEVKDSFTSFC